uniref:Putative HNH endonuclease n=1 Tax=viral metagenome TaxID=1070528 RepID=A0A6M3K6B6_9ZZZZ
MPKKGYKQSEEQKKKIGLANKGKIRTKEQKEKYRLISLNIMNKPEMKEKVSELTKEAMKRPETRKKISRFWFKKGEASSFKGKKRLNISGSNHYLFGKHSIPWNIGLKGYKSGKDNCNWKGGITNIYDTVRTSDEYKDWRNSVYKRDNYICQDCGDNRGGNLEAHHIKPFAIILQEFLQIYSQFSPIEDKETLVRLAISYEPFWNINNGQTLCIECHNLLRKNTLNIIYSQKAGGKL